MQKGLGIGSPRARGVLLYYFVRQPLKGRRRLMVGEVGHDDGCLVDGRARRLFSSDRCHPNRRAPRFLQKTPSALGWLLVMRSLHSNNGLATRGDIMYSFVFLPGVGCFAGSSVTVLRQTAGWQIADEQVGEMEDVCVVR